jgi:Ca2+/Na+ antiporter
VGTVLSSLFVDVTLLPQNGFGFFQLIFLMGAYAFVLFNGSNMISDGSELLLLIPALAGIVGSVVLPVLGAVPDGAIVLFSGLGPGAQTQLAVGVGALAGSTIMLLTIPWVLSIWAGRVDMVNGKPQYTCPKGTKKSEWSKLTPGNNSWSNTGIEVEGDVKFNANIMMATGALYLIIQIPAFFYTGSNTVVAAGERYYALVGLIACTAAFLAYLVYMFRSSAVEEKVERKVNSARQDAIKGGKMTLAGLFFAEIDEMQSNGTANENTSLNGDSAQKAKFTNVIKPFFSKYDKNGDNQMDQGELKLVLADLNMPNSDEDVAVAFAEADQDRSGFIELAEFAELCWVMCLKMVNEGVATAVTAEGKMEEGTAEDMEEDEEEEEEEDEEMPEDLQDLPPKEQQRRVLLRSLKMMGAGTLLVLLFSDPMVACLSELGVRTGVPPFYVSFILAPLASNASELIASYNYALKKTKKTITISFVQLEGAACMNNTFCLAIFMALIYFVNLAWYYSAETISIIFVLLCMGVVAQKKVHTVWDGILVLMLYPISLAIVMVLELGFGLQ